MKIHYNRPLPVRIATYMLILMLDQVVASMLTGLPSEDAGLQTFYHNE